MRSFDLVLCEKSAEQIIEMRKAADTGCDDKQGELEF
jgi:hypothetical protein